MSNSVDEEVVRLRFDNTQFEAGIRKTLGSLLDLNKGLQLTGATKGLDQVSSAARRFSLAGIAESVSNISSRFNTLSVVAITALTNIANKVVNAGAQMAKSLTVSPITDGLHEYETQLNSIQTILANTGLTGKAGLDKVNKALNDLNHYSDLTIYNFTEMARNIGTFTAAGIDLNTSVNAIKGIANLAAVSGSSSAQASTAMYQLSQALATGTVKLMDWNSVVNAGMGGKVFQESLKETARAHGVAVDKIIKDEGSFRDSLQTGWLTSDVLTETLNKFTGDLNASQLKTMGYTDKQIVGILKMGKTAKEAATKVKTFSQLIGTLQEAAGSGWTTTWSLIFGNFNEARDLFTGVNNVLSGFINASANARNKVLGDWKELGGRTVIIKAIGTAFNALVDIIRPIKDAFREIFPAKTGQQLYDISVSILNFANGLKIGADTANNLRRTFAGVFAIFGIGWEIVKQLVKTFTSLFSTATEGSGSFLEITARVGDFLVRLHDAVKNGEGLTNFFSGLSKVLTFPIKLLRIFSALIGSAFSDNGGGLTKLQARLEPFGKLGEVIARVWSHIIVIMKNVFKVVEPLIAKISGGFSELISAIEDSLANADFSGFLDAVNTGLLAAFVLTIKKFLKNGLGGLDVSGGIIGTIKDTFGALTSTLTAMQTQLKSTTLLKIAAALALLTVSVVALSLIDSGKLTKALTAIAVMFGQLAVAMVILSKVTGSIGFVKLPVITASLILLAIAIDILATAVAKLSGLSWTELLKGLTGVAVLLGSLALATKAISGQAGGMIAAGASIILLAAGIRILVGAVTDLSGLSWEEMAQGLTGVAAILVALSLFSKFAGANKAGVLSGAGIILLAAGIKVLASALKDISNLSWGELAKGLVGMAGGLVLIAAALALMPPTSLLSAAAVLIVATSLGILAGALGKMGSMTWSEIAKGLIVLASALTIIAVAITLMIVALPGAAALLVVAAALKIFVPILITLGTLPWGVIAKGLITLAAAFAVIGVAGLLLTPVVPTLLGLGAAVALLGIGLLAAGAGVLAFSIGLTALSVAGAAAAAVVVGVVSALIGLIPKVMQGIALGIAAFAQTLATAAPAMFKAMSTIITALLDAIVKLAPKILQTLATLLIKFLQIMAASIPKMVSAGFKIILGILTGISNNIGKIVTVATTIIVNFLNALSKNQPRVVDAGFKMIIAFINGLSKAIKANSAALGSAAAGLGTAIIEGMIRGLAGGIGRIASEAKKVAQSALNAAKGALGIHSPSKEFERIGNYVNDGFVKGLQGNRSQVTDAFNNLKQLLHDAIVSSKADVDQAKKHLETLTHAHHKNAKAIKEARQELAKARNERDKTSAAYSTLTKHLDDERDKLKKLADSYDKVTAKLDAAQQVLADAKKTRDDFNKSVKDEFSQLPEIAADTKIGDYIANLKKQIEDTKTFATAIQKLRSLGLNDDIYKQLLAKGTDALPFIQQILDSGLAGIVQLNALDGQLTTAAGGLGKSASENLYQAAVDSAQGLVDGLKKQQKNIEKIMEQIADAMVKAIKKKLKIKSPSEVFSDIGVYSAEGLAQGLDKTSAAVSKAASDIGDDAILALGKSLAGMGDLVNQNIDLVPTITPVIDLTRVKKDAGQIASLIGNQKTIAVDSAYARARSAKAAFDGALTPNTTPTGTPQIVRPIEFNQYNTSPKALSDAQIYRQTKNQLSAAKGALNRT